MPGRSRFPQELAPVRIRNANETTDNDPPPTQPSKGTPAPTPTPDWDRVDRDLDNPVTTWRQEHPARLIAHTLDNARQFPLPYLSDTRTDTPTSQFSPYATTPKEPRTSTTSYPIISLKTISTSHHHTRPARNPLAGQPTGRTGP